jgi:hypothetical protein
MLLAQLIALDMLFGANRIFNPIAADIVPFLRIQILTKFIVAGYAVITLVSILPDVLRLARCGQVFSISRLQNRFFVACERAIGARLIIVVVFVQSLVGVAGVG